MFSASHWESAQNGDMKIRNDIAVEYQELVEYSAARLSKKLPKHVEFDDLKASGQFGLMDAIDKYDPSRGFKFETYAVSRIRGAMIDDLRSLDWVPRSVRFKERQVANAIEKMTMLLGREPTEEELIEELDIELGDLQEILFESESSYLWNIDTPVDDDNEQTLADLIVCDISMVAQEKASINVEVILKAIDSLQEKERATIDMHYYLGFTLAEIGRKFKVTESRVCQIHTKALRQIREALING